MKMIRGIFMSYFTDMERRYEFNIIDNDERMDEVVRIHRNLFDKSYKKQRKVMRMLIWWSIKHYFKILFK